MTVEEVYGCAIEALIAPEGYEFTDEFRFGTKGDMVLGNGWKLYNIANEAMLIEYLDCATEPRLTLRPLKEG